jgi:glutathione S-transferase
VTGTLVAADAQEIIIRKDTPETGVLHIHFPRAGFETLPVTSSAQSAA